MQARSPIPENSKTFAVESYFPTDGIDESLIMDWEGEMGGKQFRKAQQKKHQQSDSTTPDQSLTKQDVENIISAQITTLRADLIATTPPAIGETKWWSRHWSIAIGSALLSGILILATSGVISHRAKDFQAQITDEVRTQLDRRSTADASNLNNHISAEVAKQLGPIHQQLESLNQDIGKIKDHLHIAQARPATAPPSQPQNSGPSLETFAVMDQKKFAESLPTLHTALSNPAANGNLEQATPALRTLRQIAIKLRQTSESRPEYWPTVLQFIQFASFAMVPPSDVPPPDAKFWEMQNVSCSGLAHCIRASHSAILLDGGNIPGSIFYHCRIRFTENPTGLSGVIFNDCVFEMPASSNPSPYLKDATRILLAGNLTKVSFPKS
jgi:hypothetical protein